MSQHTSVTPESDEELLEKFKLDSGPILRKIIKSIEADEHELYVYLLENNTRFVTEILGIDWDTEHIWFSTPTKALNSQCTSTCPYTIVSFPDGIKVQFGGNGIFRDQFQGVEALRVPIPNSIVRLQRRNFFRVVADEELNHHVKLDIPNVQKKITLIDLSLAGFGFSLEAILGQYPKGKIIKDVRLTLPDETASMLVQLIVQNIKPMLEPPGHIILGCEIKSLERNAERRLQRFLLTTERRQRAHLYS